MKLIVFGTLSCLFFFLYCCNVSTAFQCYQCKAVKAPMGGKDQCQTGELSKDFVIDCPTNVCVTVAVNGTVERACDLSNCREYKKLPGVTFCSDCNKTLCNNQAVSAGTTMPNTLYQFLGVGVLFISVLSSYREF